MRVIPLASGHRRAHGACFGRDQREDAMKICRHCSTQSETTSAKCPACGKRYVARKRWPWVLGGLALVMILGFVSCAALISSVAKSLSAEQAKHAITTQQYDAVQTGVTKSALVAELGKQPEDAQQFVEKGFLSAKDVTTACVYYNRKGGKFGDRFQFCFTNDLLDHKAAY